MAENRTSEAALNLARLIRETNQAVAQSTIAAQERNIRFAQSVFENGVEVLKSHAENTRSLMQTVVKQTQEQQEALWTQPFVEAYLNVLSAPFSYYKQALETAQAVTGQAMDIAQKTARQGMEAAQEAAQQGFEHARKTAQQGMEHTQSVMGQQPPTAE